jgi:hypothetical protein
VAKPPEVVEAEIRQLLAQPLDDATLRRHLKELAPEPTFSGFTWLWGPVLYRRNRALFRPLILRRFASTQAFGPPNYRWRPVAWQGEVAEALDQWLEEVDRDDDAVLFRRLYVWKHAPAPDRLLDGGQWLRDLLNRYRAAGTRYERGRVLARFDLPGGLHGGLDEDTAVALYEHDPVAAAPFLRKHAPGSGYPQAKRVRWNRLAELVRQRGDDATYFALYRKQVPLQDWAHEVLRLAELPDCGALVEELRKRHPEGWNLDLGDGLEQLLRRRGRDIFPYLKELFGPPRRARLAFGIFRRLAEVAREHDWLDLWGALLRLGASVDEYNQEVSLLLAERRLPDAEVQRRLCLLAGVVQEWSGGGNLAPVPLLRDATAVALHERFPALVRGPFRIQLGVYGGCPRLLDRLLAAEDEALLDYLASRVVTWVLYPRTDADTVGQVTRLANYYRQLLNRGLAFAERAAAVLCQVPADRLSYHHAEQSRPNALANLLFGRTAAACLDEPRVVRDLLEAPAIPVLALALRALARDDDRARLLARQNVDLLEAALVRPLPRAVRLPALRALANAAGDADTARRVHDRARAALDLRDRGYPREQLIGLLGQLLHRWPELRQPWEQPIVYVRRGR